MGLCFAGAGWVSPWERALDHYIGASLGWEAVLAP